MRYILVALSGLLVLGCATKEMEPRSKIEAGQDANNTIYDLVTVPQNIEHYTKNVNFTKISYINSDTFEKSYFSAWSIKKPEHSLEDLQWAFHSYKPSSSYGENLQPLNENFFNSMLKKANFDAYQTLNKKAISLSHLNIRAFPTEKPLFLDPQRAGEGYPFDYLQNSTIGANKPLFVTHYSKDKQWVHIITSFTYGWVKTKEVVFLKPEYTNAIQEAKQVRIIQEGLPIYSSRGVFLFKSRIGTMLPLIAEDEENYTVLVISTLPNNEPFFQRVVISKDIAEKNTLVLNRDNFESIINQIQNSKYGWGGMYRQRDCSSMLRDIFSPFGIWLPRNSYQQSLVGERISLEGLSNVEKTALVQQKAIPFKTLLYKQGHIMLYVGTYEDEIIIFHDAWGIKTKSDKKEGRVIIGKPIFSTLKLGSKQKEYDESSELLKNLKSMNILTF